MKGDERAHFSVVGRGGYVTKYSRAKNLKGGGMKDQDNFLDSSALLSVKFKPTLKTRSPFEKTNSRMLEKQAEFYIQGIKMSSDNNTVRGTKIQLMVFTCIKLHFSSINLSEFDARLLLNTFFRHGNIVDLLSIFNINTAYIHVCCIKYGFQNTTESYYFDRDTVSIFLKFFSVACCLQILSIKNFKLLQFEKQ